MRIARLTTVFVAVVTVSALLAPLVSQLRAAPQAKPAPPPMKLKVGDMAPDFHFKYFDGAKLQDVSLNDFKGKKNVALAFFVLAFTGG